MSWLSKYNASLPKFFLIISAFLLAYLIFEVYTRLAESTQSKKSSMSFFLEDNLLPQTLAPDIQKSLESRNPGEFKTQIQITSQGLREAQIYSIPKPKNTFRILMLGDSFTFGFGVENEESFPEILEKSLSGKIKNKNIEVINAGISSGFTWDEAYLYLEERGLAFEPDLIIESAWLGNDIQDINAHQYPMIDENGLPKRIVSKTAYIKNGYLLTRKDPDAIGNRGAISLLNKYFCNPSFFCVYSLRPIIDKYLLGKNNSLLQDVDDENFLLEPLPNYLQDGWQKGQKMLKGLQDLAKSSNAQFMLVVIPIREQIYDPQGILTGRSLNQNRLADFAESEKITLCDLLPKLKEKGQEAYFRIDPHLTIIGHQRTAQKIEECIVVNKFIE